MKQHVYHLPWPVPFTPSPDPMPVSARWLSPAYWDEKRREIAYLDRIEAAKVGNTKAGLST
jgi:hypothetical protein